MPQTESMTSSLKAMVAIVTCSLYVKCANLYFHLTKCKIEKFYIYNAPYIKDHSVAIISYTFYHACCNHNS